MISRWSAGAIASGVICTIATVGWILQLLASIWMYKQVWSHSHGEKGTSSLFHSPYNLTHDPAKCGTGHTFAQAKAEMQMHGIKAYLFKGNVGGN